MKDQTIYTDEEVKSIKAMLNIFVGAKVKYNLFDFINKSKKNHMYRNFLCESLFRHTILELYATFFDNDKDSVAYQIVSKFIKASKQNSNEDVKQLLGEVTRIKKHLEFYRNNNLAHKSRKLKKDFHITSDDFSSLVNITEQLILGILKIIEPTTAYATDINLVINHNKAIQLFFKGLASVDVLEN